MYSTYTVNKVTIIKFNSDTFTDEIKEKIDKLIIQICEGELSYNNTTDSEGLQNIRSIKKELYDRIKRKDRNTQKGFISEFFVHLILNQEGFKQECLFFNLSDRGIKKGFDGLYSKSDSQLWIVDSKSGDCKTNNISHSNKIMEAYKNCGGLLNGTGTTNDIWREAWNQVSHNDVNTSDSIKQIVKGYRNQSSLTIDSCNIIPCSTIFIRKSGNYATHSNYSCEKNDPIFSQSPKNMVLFHATNKFFIDFLKYLKKGIKDGKN